MQDSESNTQKLDQPIKSKLEKLSEKFLILWAISIIWSVPIFLIVVMTLVSLTKYYCFNIVKGCNFNIEYYYNYISYNGYEISFDIWNYLWFSFFFIAFIIDTVNWYLIWRETRFWIKTQIILDSALMIIGVILFSLTILQNFWLFHHSWIYAEFMLFCVFYFILKFGDYF